MKHSKERKSSQLQKLTLDGIYKEKCCQKIYVPVCVCVLGVQHGEIISEKLHPATYCFFYFSTNAS